MKYRKKEKIIAEDKLSEYERHQNDHEQFLLAFERPTQIYRYLRTRQMSSPIFLQRNLNYMQNRRPRKRRKRSEQSLETINEKLKKSKSTSKDRKLTNLHLEVKGVSGVEHESVQNATLEVCLVKASQKRKKGAKFPALETKLLETSVPCNPKDKAKPVPLHLTSNMLHLQNGYNSKSYSLLFRVSYGVSSPVTSSGNNGQRLVSALPNGIANGSHLSDTGVSASEDESDEQPAKKRRKTRSTVKPTTDPSEQAVTRHVFDSELMVCDDSLTKLLTDGHYDVILYDARTEKSDAPQEWSLVKEETKALLAFATNPVLKFEARWSTGTDEKLNNETDLQPFQSQGPHSPSQTPAMLALKPEAPLNNNYTDGPTGGDDPLSPSSLSKRQQQPQRVFYHFIYANKTRQQTEARTDMHCPWCVLNCCTLYSLLKHLRNCHSRFNFTYFEHPKGARVDVTINDNYDGSYVGNPLDLQAHIGYCFGCNGPVRRTPVTQLLVYKPKKPSFDLSEFMEPETEVHVPRHIHGHNRLYNHAVTLAPLRPSEMDFDSEDELDPDWLRQKTVNLIDEFTDVNEGEKEIMKMWNIHVMNYNFLGDCQVSKACTMFIQEYGPEIIQRNLCRNLIIHLTNLYDFGLVKPECVSKTVLQLHRLRAKMYADGLLLRETPVHVNKKWDPLRNYCAVPIVAGDAKDAPKLVPDSCCNLSKSSSSVGGGKTTIGGVDKRSSSPGAKSTGS